MKMKNRKDCVIDVDIWEDFKVGRKGFFPFVGIVPQKEGVKMKYMKGDCVIAEITAGSGAVQWIESNKKVNKKFKCDCWTWVEGATEVDSFRLSTLEEAQALFELEHKENEQKHKFSFRKLKQHGKEETSPTLVYCEDFVYALLNRKYNIVEGYFVISSDMSNYPQYANLIRGMKLYARGAYLNSTKEI